MSDNVKVLLVGVGYMGLEYYKVLRAMKCEVFAIGRGKESAEKFQHMDTITCKSPISAIRMKFYVMGIL